MDITDRPSPKASGNALVYCGFRAKAAHDSDLMSDQALYSTPLAVRCEGVCRCGRPQAVDMMATQERCPQASRNNASDSSSRRMIFRSHEPDGSVCLVPRF